MFVITNHRVFKTEGEATNYCVKYTIPLKNIEKVDEKFEVPTAQKDLDSINLRCCYIDKRGDHHYS